MSWIFRVNAAMRGWPEATLTGLLLALAAVAALVALTKNTVLKAAVAAWMLLP